MSGHQPEVADVIRIDGAAFLKRYRLSKEQYRVFNALQECRTAALGACCKRCDKCGHEVTVYCSCRNRHRAEKIELARILLSDQTSSAQNEAESPEPPQPQQDAAGEPIDDLDICPKCKQGRLVIFLRVGFFFVRKSWSFDSS